MAREHSRAETSNEVLVDLGRQWASVSQAIFLHVDRAQRRIKQHAMSSVFSDVGTPALRETQKLLDSSAQALTAFPTRLGRTLLELRSLFWKSFWTWWKEELFSSTSTTF